MSAQVVIFEDAGWTRLYPFTLSRPSFDCRTGVGTLARRLMAQLGQRKLKRVEFITRPLLRPWTEREYPGHSVNQSPEGEVIFLNGRLLCLGECLDDLLILLDKAVAVQEHGELAAARLTGTEAGRFAEELSRALEKGEPAPFPPDHTVTGAPAGVHLPRYPWDLVSLNGEVLADDFDWIHQSEGLTGPQLSPGAQLIEKPRILARADVQVQAGAILDASTGPIFLGEGVRILHNAVVQGPAFIGHGSTVKVGAKLEGPVSIGPVCKVGGEVEGSIFQGYANKQHDGFLGHAYLGAWTNLGAATNNSDLKNNYGTVRVELPDGEVDTGLTFAGLYLGDHSKTAIGTVFNTGTVVGFSCNLFGAGFPPKHVPSFSWGGAGGLQRYDLEKALAVARTVMARRRVTMEPADTVLFRSLYPGD